MGEVHRDSGLEERLRDDCGGLPDLPFNMSFTDQAVAGSCRCQCRFGQIL